MRNWLSILLFILCIPVLAQKISPEKQALADRYKEQFPEADVVIDRINQSYEFAFNKSASTVQVNESSDKNYISLKYSATTTDRVFFNKQVKINSYELKNHKGKSIDGDKFCGHYNQRGIFHSDAQLCAYKVYLNQKGETKSTELESTYLDSKYLTTVYFHEEQPVIKNHIAFKIPSWVDVDLLEINFDGWDIEKKETALSDGRLVEYTAENLEAFPTYEDQPGSSYFMPHIMVITKSYTRKGETVDMLSSTASLYQWYNSLTKDLQINTEALQPLVNELIKDAKDDREKIKNIYYWVQDNIKYIAYEEGIAAFKPEQSDQVLKNMYGDCKGMANLTRSMLELAGFDARLSWLGTNRLAYTYDTPSLAVDNHMICSVKLSDGFLHLDATEKNNVIGDYAERIQGKQVLVQDGDKFIIERIPVQSSSDFDHEIITKYQIEGDVLSVKGNEDISGEPKKDLINVYNSVPMEKQDLFYKTIASGKANYDKVQFSQIPTFKREEPLVLDYEIQLGEYLSVFESQFYVDMDFKKEFYNEKIEEDRKVPVKLAGKMNSISTGELTLPEKLKVEYIPEPLEIISDKFQFRLGYELKENSIFYHKKLNITDTYLPVEEFEEWNEAVSRLSKFYNDQIILTEK